jgi:hypothetical protein
MSKFPEKVGGRRRAGTKATLRRTLHAECGRRAAKRQTWFMYSASANRSPSAPHSWMPPFDPGSVLQREANASAQVKDAGCPKAGGWYLQRDDACPATLSLTCLASARPTSPQSPRADRSRSRRSCSSCARGRRAPVNGEKRHSISQEAERSRIKGTMKCKRAASRNPDNSACTKLAATRRPPTRPLPYHRVQQDVAKRRRFVRVQLRTAQGRIASEWTVWLRQHNSNASCECIWSQQSAKQARARATIF